MTDPSETLAQDKTMKKLLIIFFATICVMPIQSMHRSNKPQNEFNRLARESQTRRVQGLPESWTERTDPKDTCSIEIRCKSCKKMNVIQYPRGDTDPVPTHYSCRHCGAINPPVRFPN